MLESLGLELLAFSPPGWGGNLLRGLGMTLQIAFGAYALGLFIGLGGALGKIYGGPTLRWSLEIYTTLVRAVPELVLILLLYYAGTDLLNRLLESFGFERVDISGLAAGIYVLGFVQGAYIIEVIRGAIVAVPIGQIEAAKACGMSWVVTHRRIIIPAMVPLALPGLANLWLIVTKDTALLAVVGFSELALETKQAAGGTKEYLMFYLAAAFLYLCVSLISNVIFRLLERYYRRGQPDLS
ncbi:ABC transporter permease [Candidatus Spongiihabitans sp.]|uniref:ABC transporter permease n=1 Tax=Candidatus Spongiihabitans sp. TaxID=3101308 RepID=UPI003C7A40D8